MMRPQGTTTLQAVQKLIAAELELDPAALDPSRPLEELGIDSLSVMECLFKIEDEFKISVAGTSLAVTTLQEIADMVDSLLAMRVAEVS
jgi:acyl carrier protein